MENISEHISYSEATKSNLAIKKRIDNTPDEEQLKNMKLVAEHVFEPTRKHFGKALFVTSFFRSEKLNKALGGSKTSQHMEGKAMDIDGDLSGIDNREIYKFIKENLEFDQIIIENADKNGKPAWIHVSYSEGNNRKQVFQKKKGSSKYILVS